MDYQVRPYVSASGLRPKRRRLCRKTNPVEIAEAGIGGETLADMHELIIEHFAAVGLLENLLADIRSSLSCVSCQTSFNSLLFKVFQFARTGNMELTEVNFAGECR